MGVPRPRTVALAFVHDHRGQPNDFSSRLRGTFPPCDLSHNLGEARNVAAVYPERTEAMAARLQSIRQAGRSQR
jgi:hypothetical protein